MRVLVCGDRRWSRFGPIERELRKLPQGSTVIHGGAKGADTIAGYVAKQLGFEVEKYDADWGQYGKAAGPIRNTQMLVEGKPEQVWAFHSNIIESKGTKNMLSQAEAAGVPTKLFVE